MKENTALISALEQIRATLDQIEVDASLRKKEGPHMPMHEGEDESEPAVAVVVPEE